VAIDISERMLQRAQ
jgi:ubiquinone/menaquinone biosynthesis C-methylase UbiE